MGYDNNLTQQVRAALAHLPDVEEKQMFGSLAFMVDGKMCITVGEDRIMCRINPALQEQALKRKGCQQVVMGGRKYKGYVYIGRDGMQTRNEFDYWIGLALDYNRETQPSPKRKRSS